MLLPLVGLYFVEQVHSHVPRDGARLKLGHLHGFWFFHLGLAEEQSVGLEVFEQLDVFLGHFVELGEDEVFLAFHACLVGQVFVIVDRGW